MGTTIKDFYAGVVLATLLALASCDRGAEAPTTGEPVVTTSLPAASGSDGEQYASRGSSDDDRGPGPGSDRRTGEAPLHDDGAPMWSSNSRNTAEENAQRLFERNGKAFGADTVEEYVDQAHAFIADPPKGTLRLSRDNGDRLYYDPKGNTFVVATREGAPRTMFKPDDGATYWREQEREVSERRGGGGRS